VTFAERYLEALADLALPRPVLVDVRRSSFQVEQQRREREYAARRTEELVGWYLMLLWRFAGTDDEPLLDRLAGHAALGGLPHRYFRARLARTRGDLETARRLVQEVL